MIVAGLGFRASATEADLAEVLAFARVPGMKLDALATIPQRAVAPAMQACAASLGLPIRAVAVAGQPTPTQSARVAARFGTGSIAEAAALVAAGPDARLIVGRVTLANGMATAAIAEGSGP
jgi:cobalt-precorrin 5A hydrolase